MKKHKSKKVLKFSSLSIGILFLVSILLGQSNLGNLSQNENNKDTFITIGDEKIRYLQKGEGKDILFIHGTPGSIEDWKELIDSLSQNFRVTAFDRLGHGYSSANKYTYHLKDNADLAEQLIENMKLNSPLIVGHSYGGCVATYMAVNSKSIEREYVIIDSPFCEIQPSIINRLVSAPILGRGIAFLSAYTIAKHEIKKGILPMFKSMEGDKLNYYIKERQEIWSQPKVIYSNSKEIVNLQYDLKSLSENYKITDARMILITEEDSIDTFRKSTEKLHKELKNSELIIIKNTGHYIQLEQSSQMIKIIREKANQLMSKN